MTADNPDPLLPLPFAALVLVKFQTCPRCHQRFEREDVVRVGLATQNLEGTRHPPYLFYSLRCQNCRQICDVSMPTQSEMSVTRFADECEHGRHLELTGKAKPPAIENSRSRRTPRPPQSSKADRPEVYPSIRRSCPTSPITDDTVAAAKRKLRSVSFKRTSPTFQRLLSQFGIKPQPPEDGPGQSPG